MKTAKEIKEKIEYTHDAMINLDEQGNQVEANKLEIKIEILEWVLGYKWINTKTS